MKRFLYYWLPVVSFMGIIFYLSSRRSVELSDELTINFILFKSLHVIEYATLFFLLFRAVSHSFSKASLQKRLVICAVIAILYGVSDEIHQTFVPTREGKLRDVLIDSVGVFLMYSYIRRYVGRIPKYVL